MLKISINIIVKEICPVNLTEVTDFIVNFAIQLPPDGVFTKE